MIRWRLSDGSVPTPDAVRPVGNPGRRGVQKAPVNGSPGAIVVMGLARLIPKVSFIGRLQINEGSRWWISPLPTRGARVNPAHGIRVISMTTLVNDKIQPFLVTEALPWPMHPDGVGGYGSMGAFVKC